MSLREAYKQKLAAQMEEQRARLGALKAHAKRVAADSRIVGYEELARAEKSVDRIASKLKRVAGAGLQALSEVRGGMGKAIDDLALSTKRAASHLSEAKNKPAAAKARRTPAPKVKFKAAPKRSSLKGKPATRRPRRKSK